MLCCFRRRLEQFLSSCLISLASFDQSSRSPFSPRDCLQFGPFGPRLRQSQPSNLFLLFRSVVPFHSGFSSESNLTFVQFHFDICRFLRVFFLIVTPTLLTPSVTFLFRLKSTPSVILSLGSSFLRILILFCVRPSSDFFCVFRP